MIYRIALILSLLAVQVFAYTPDDPTKTITSDGSLSDTQGAIDYVVAKNQDGWVLTVGTVGGSYTWLTTPLSISIAHTFTIQGASPSNRTTVTCSPGADDGFGIVLGCTPLKTITVKDFIFPETDANKANFLVSGEGLDCFRFTNCKWIHPGSSAIFVGYISSPGSASLNEGPYGLIDHCEMLGSGAGFIIHENNSSDAASAPSEAWLRPMTFGTRKAVFLEDSTFGNTTITAGRAIIDCVRGGRFVFRHNTVVNDWIGDHGADHVSTLQGSALQHEVMHNAFSFDGASFTAFVFFRGGTGYIFDNDFTALNGSEMNRAIYWGYYRADVNGAGNVVQDRWYNALSTTIAAGSNGVALPQATINVADTTGLGSNFTSGNITFTVVTSGGAQTVNATGKTNTTFTGCTGGTGTMSTGGAVTRSSDYLGTMQPGTGYVGTAGQDPEFPSRPWGSVPVRHWSNRQNTVGTGHYLYGTAFGGGDSDPFMAQNRDWFESSDASAAPVGYTEYTYPHPLQGAPPAGSSGARKIGRGSTGGAPALAR